MNTPDTTSFEEFAASLPACAAAGRFPMTGAREDVRYCVDQLPEFVGPNLRRRTDLDDSRSPSIVIISAAGAVGKSTLAMELARSKGAPLWDLSRSKSVGQGSVDGMISQAFGRTSAGSQVHSALDVGTLFLVVDALDEARVKVTETAFEDFLREIGLLASEGPGVKAVILGRTQVAETAWLLLDDQGVQTSFYTIAPFDRAQALRYIERRIRRLGATAERSMEQNPAPFAEARDLLFAKLGDAVRGNRTEADAASELDSFLGYAPVLDAMAVRLGSDPNWAAQKQAIAAAMPLHSGAKPRPAAILRQVIEAVLTREREQKLVSNLKPVLEGLAAEARWSDWDRLYSVDEQCARLLGRHLGISTTLAGRLNLPPVLGARYEEQLESWLPEHPLLRDGKTIANVVFEAYLFARALGEDVGGSRTAVEARLRQPAYLPTRLLGEFYLLSKGDRGDPDVAPDHIGWLYDSMLSDETPDVRIEFSLDGPDPMDADSDDEPQAVEGEFLFVQSSGSSEIPARVEFSTRVWPRTVVTFGRYVKLAAINLPCDIVLGAGGDEFEIGPGVHINCRKLKLNTRAIVVGGKSRMGEAEANAVTLEAQECDSSVVVRPTVRGTFRVNWPGSNAFPWNEFSQEQRGPYPPDSQMDAAYRRFRRIVMTLRSHGKGALARYKPKVNHRRVLQGELGEELLKTLLDDGVMRARGDFYFWVPDIASAKVGISWQQLSRRETSLQLNAYLEEFLRARS